jgi:hypothetical protein
MFSYVNSSFGWNPSSKRNELFGEDSRYLLVRPFDSSRNVTTAPVAYAMFQFERENKENVVYWYVLL